MHRPPDDHKRNRLRVVKSEGASPYMPVDGLGRLFTPPVVVHVNPNPTDEEIRRSLESKKGQ